MAIDNADAGDEDEDKEVDALQQESCQQSKNHCRQPPAGESGLLGNYQTSNFAIVLWNISTFFFKRTKSSGLVDLLHNNHRECLGLQLN
jgi:hypothetical protein